LKRIINVPKRKLGNVTVQRLEEYSKYIGESMFDAILSFDVAAGTKKELNSFSKIIKKFSEAIEKNINLSDLIDLILNESGYKEMLLAEGDQGIDRIQNILELRGVFKRGEFLYEGDTKEKLTQILDEISLMTDADKNVATEDKVILSTYHQVKGLEFKAVFMVAMEEDIFPNANAIYSKGGLEEERRIAYVGITRAKRHLFLTHSDSRFRFGRKEYNRPSRFYLETMDTMGRVKPSYLGGGSVEYEADSSFEIGDKVEHQLFGAGKIVAIEGEVAVIAFSAEHGIKKIILGHPSLKKSK
jgi:DNA helicase-2/ATP-dependent DNA helicase PcrA